MRSLHTRHFHYLRPGPSPSGRSIDIRIITKAHLISVLWLILIIVLSPIASHASCLDDSDSAYNFAVSQGNYDQAFRLIAGELRLSSEEARHFKIVQGFSDSHDDRHGQADPESLELRLDPGLFIEGKEGACQGVAHERQHLCQFQRDRRRLHAHYSGKPDAAHAEEEAYDSLQDNDLVTHAAADDIEAVLAQLPYASRRTLRDEDFSYLLDNLKNWADHSRMVSDQLNESYYLPEIKREDIRIFCRGTDYARKSFANPAPFYQAWLAFCRLRH